MPTGDGDVEVPGESTATEGLFLGFQPREAERTDYKEQAALGTMALGHQYGVAFFVLGVTGWWADGKSSQFSVSPETRLQPGGDILPVLFRQQQGPQIPTCTPGPVSSTSFVVLTVSFSVSSHHLLCVYLYPSISLQGLESYWSRAYPYDTI